MLTEGMFIAERYEIIGKNADCFFVSQFAFLLNICL